jgi:hypothetical protein
VEWCAVIIVGPEVGRYGGVEVEPLAFSAVEVLPRNQELAQMNMNWTTYPIVIIPH